LEWPLCADIVEKLGRCEVADVIEPALALQLPTCFEMRTLSGGLVSSAPE
jgi:hypothetical protein